MKIRLLTALLLVTVTVMSPLAAQQLQQRPTIGYVPVMCMHSDEMAVLFVTVVTEGTLRAYFRPTGGADWCSVEGKNLGKDSYVTMPKFDEGKEMEYYFVTIKRNEITARSPRVYKARITSHCDTLYDRKNAFLILDCNPQAGGMPAAMGAGYIAEEIASTDLPPVTSPDKPVSNQ